MKNKIKLLLAGLFILTASNVSADELSKLDAETIKTKQDIERLKKQELALEKQARLLEAKKTAGYTTTTNKYKVKKRTSHRKRYTSRSSRSGKKVTQHINYKRPKYIVRDYYPTFSKDLKTDYDMQMRRENRLKDTL